MQTFVTQHGYLAVFVLMVLESACIPIPSEITMVLGGALTTSAFAASVGVDPPLNFVAVALAGTLGNLVGSWIAYGVGYVGGRPLIDRWGRYILLRQNEVDRAHVWFERHGEAAVFFGRLLPVIRTFISLPAGVARMEFWRFTVFTVLGCLPWTFALTWGGSLLGANWHELAKWFKPISIVIAVALLVVIAVWVVRRLRSRKGVPSA